MNGNDYRMMVESAPTRIAVDAAGVRLAESGVAKLLRETRQPPVYYFPRRDVALSHLEPSALRTHCPFKGNARYWHVVIGDVRLENAVWSYETPCEDAAEIGGLLAFQWDLMDKWWADEEQIGAPARVMLDAPNPHAMWLMHAADRTQPAEQMLAAFSTHLRAQGLPLLRLGVLVRTLHPLEFAWGVLDWKDRSRPETFELPYEVLRDEEFRASPYAPILAGEGGVRRRIDADARREFAILDALAEQGATDYAAMPMQFSDGQINILTLVADGEDGFRTEQLGPIHEMLPLLSSIFEVYSQRRLSAVLLDTYLGAQTGTRVLAGKIRRGASETIPAIIWFSDLRDSTRLTEALGQKDYLELLNDYFDCMAGAVLAHGGEVLKYIGDAVMAIFPVADRDEVRPAAAADAVAAARDASARVQRLNAARSERGDEAMGFGIALHRGDFTYGNIGTSKRLDFTVIGGAANEAARIEALTKALGENVLVSGSVAQSVPDTLPFVGRHSLRGVGAVMNLFALPDGASEQRETNPQPHE